MKKMKMITITSLIVTVLSLALSGFLGYRLSEEVVDAESVPDSELFTKFKNDEEFPTDEFEAIKEYKKARAYVKNELYDDLVKLAGGENHKVVDLTDDTREVIAPKLTKEKLQQANRIQGKLEKHIYPGHSLLYADMIRIWGCIERGKTTDRDGFMLAHQIAHKLKYPKSEEYKKTHTYSELSLR